ncbi:MAG: hypothetical protein ACTH2Q_18530 [Propionibacteriaceae bacterium]
MGIASFGRSHRTALVLAAVLVLLLGVVAALGGFGRSDRPVRTVAVGQRVELGQFAWTVHGARVVDRDEDGEPFEEEPLHVLVDVTVENISDESSGLSKDLIGIRVGPDEFLPFDLDTSGLHPNLPLRLELILLAQEDSPLEIGGHTDIWLGAQQFAWTNLINSGPEWSVPRWAAIVTDVPLADDRGSR